MGCTAFIIVMLIIPQSYNKPLIRFSVCLNKETHFYGSWKCRGEWLRAPNSNSGVSDQQSVGSSPSCDTCVLKKDTNHFVKFGEVVISAVPARLLTE